METPFTAPTQTSKHVSQYTPDEQTAANTNEGISPTGVEVCIALSLTSEYKSLIQWWSTTATMLHDYIISSNLME